MPLRDIARLIRKMAGVVNMRIFLIIYLVLTTSLAYGDGLIVQRSQSGISFNNAISVNVNDKDKALSLGSQARLSGPINKLQSVRLAGLLVKDRASGAIAMVSPGQPPVFLLPQGISKNAPADPAELWKAANLTYRKSQSEKTPVGVPSDEFVAFLPDGVPGLASLCMDLQTLALLGGKEGYFPMQIELIAAAVKAYGANPAMSVIDGYVRGTMRRNLDRFEDGIESAKSLDEGLQFAKISEQAYPGDPEHQKLRKLLSERKTWLDRRIAILRTFSAASDWDAFLLAFAEFEKHQPSFQDIQERKKQALEGSLKAHWERGKERLNSREYRSAYRELRLASFRQPSNAALQKELSVAWSEYSRELAGSRRARRVPLTPGQQDAITQAIHFASRYKEQNKLDEALKSLTEAEGIDADNLGLLLKKAEILGSRGEFSRALATLDKYDQLAVDEERAPGARLRNELAFQKLTTLRDDKTKLESAWSQQRFHLTRRAAVQALRIDDRDPDILYFAGMSSLVTRNGKEAREYLERFLETSNTIDASFERRISARRALTAIPEQGGKDMEQGEPNWLSGKRLPAGVYYCPISLAFGPRVERIEGSNKLRVQYEWEGSRLKGIIPIFEKPQDATGERPLAFTYEDSIPQVISVQPAGVALGTAADRDELLKRSSVLLINSPLVDPIALERVSGKKVTIGIAGNQFFHPFIWQKLHYFQLTYDDAGRVKSAREIPGPESVRGSEVDLEFDWDGLKLMAVRGYRRVGGDDSRRVQIYERKQVYQDNRLVGEELKAGSKISRIKYLYDGATLVSAECEKDESVDNRSREVFFAAASSRTRRR
jgi:hypothetical protein